MHRQERMPAIGTFARESEATARFWIPNVDPRAQIRVRHAIFSQVGQDAFLLEHFFRGRSTLREVLGSLMRAPASLFTFRLLGPGPGEVVLRPLEIRLQANGLFGGLDGFIPDAL